VVQKSGAFFSYRDERLGQGRANAREFLKENPDIAAAIEDQVRAKAGLPPLVRPVAAPAPRDGGALAAGEPAVDAAV
jgi:hypothetical protein